MTDRGHTYALALWLISMPVVCGQSPVAGREFRLAPGRAGGIEIGMPVDDLYRAVGREQTR
jgi:hypothetical protein